MTQTKTNKAGGFHYAYAIVAACIAMTCLPCALVLSCAGIFFTPVSTFFGVPKATFTLYFTIDAGVFNTMLSHIGKTCFPILVLLP